MNHALKEFIAQIEICDTHEHLWKQEKWVNDSPDILCELFDNYVRADFVSAGITDADAIRLVDAKCLDIKARFAPVRKIWEAIQFTGYGEASRLIARRFFEIDEITTDALIHAQEALPKRWEAGDRLRILKEDGGLHHTQTDDFCWACKRDESGPGFFLYDLSWASFCSGTFDLEQIHDETEVEVDDLDDLGTAMERLFSRYGPFAIAVKSQHAYNRTLKWEERRDGDVSAALQRLINGSELNVQEKNCLGDWCWSRGVELAIQYNLPFKIHTGYYAGNHRMPVNFIRAGNLCPLLAKYPEARFVLMHISYPYQEELIALAKHYKNVWVDMCWAWSINPHASQEFLRRYLHAAPINKLFAFGGDTMRPRAAVAYSMQARDRVGRALIDEINDGQIRETQATDIAERILQRNQLECFDYEGRVNALQARSS